MSDTPPVCNLPESFGSGARIGRRVYQRPSRGRECALLACPALIGGTEVTLDERTVVVGSCGHLPPFQTGAAFLPALSRRPSYSSPDPSSTSLSPSRTFAECSACWLTAV